MRRDVWRILESPEHSIQVWPNFVTELTLNNSEPFNSSSKVWNWKSQRNWVTRTKDLYSLRSRYQYIYKGHCLIHLELFNTTVDFQFLWWNLYRFQRQRNQRTLRCGTFWLILNIISQGGSTQHSRTKGSWNVSKAERERDEEEIWWCLCPS